MGEIRIKRDVSDAIVYGIHIDPNIQDPSNAVTYLEDAVGMTPASMGSTAFNFGSWENVFFMPKPCMVRYDGTVDYYLDPNDYTKKADGTPSDIGNLAYQGNAMMEWGLLWFKFWSGSEEGEGYFCIADRKVDDTYDCTCNYDADGNITEHFYTAIYQGTTAPNYDSTKTYAVDDIVTYSDVEYKCITAVETAEAFDGTKWTQLSETTRLRSLSGVQLIPANGNGNTTGTQEVARATACNTTAKTEWYIETWCDRVLINALLVLIGKSLDTQGTFGRGIDSGAQAQKEAYVTGALNDKGLFYGSTANGTTAVKTFGMENWWALAWHRTAGLIGSANNTYLYKMTWSTHDGSTATGYNSNGSGYLSTSGRPANNYLYKAKYDKWGFLPIVTGSSNALYYKDYFYTGTGFALCGGTSSRGTNGGAFCVSLNSAFGDAGWTVDAAPSFKPRAKTPYNPDWDNRPAHQFINGKWIDIPTHHYTNNRWQGELTSQSPLKFRADGEMLDWRIEGRTSGNLFDTSVYTNDTYIHNCTVTNTSTSVMITSTGTDPFVGFVNSPGTTVPERAQLMYIPVKPNTTYTINMSSAPKCYCTQVDESNVIKKNAQINRLPYVFTTDSATRYIIMRLGDDTLQAGNSITFENIQLIEGTYTASTIPPYESYGGVGDWDETEQKYRIPVRVEGENLFNPETSTAVYLDVRGVEHPSEKSMTSDYISVNANTRYTLGETGNTDNISDHAYCFYNSNKEFISSGTYVPSANGNIIGLLTPNDCAYFRFTYNHLRELVEFVEGKYTRLPPYSTTTNLYTDHQLMDGDSIDYTTTETTIPLATGNNTLTVDTAVKPSKVFIKFEG